MGKPKSIFKGIGIISLVALAAYGILKLKKSENCSCYIQDENEDECTNCEDCCNGKDKESDIKDCGEEN